MAQQNPYYQRCMYLKTTFVDHGISSYSTHFCVKWGHQIDYAGMKTMCCISNSPYMKKNCKDFKDKSGTEQQTLGD